MDISWPKEKTVLGIGHSKAWMPRAHGTFWKFKLSTPRNQSVSRGGQGGGEHGKESGSSRRKATEMDLF